MSKEQVVIVTGASGGFGSAIALKFAKHRAKLVLTGRNAEKLSGVADSCRSAGSSSVVIVQADLKQRDQLENVIYECVKAFGCVDVLVNNAGVFIPQTFEKATDYEFDEMFAVNVKAPFFLMQHAMPYLLKTKGSVVNISSYLHPSPELLMVSRMSRGALDQLTINAASKYASEGVRVNSVRPATALTELTLAAPEDVLNFEKSKQPIGGFIAHENVANAVYFLASSEAAQTTGQFLNVDGGASVLST